MFAQVIDGTITSFPKGNKGIQIGDLKYPKAIYSLWTEAERNAIGIYTVIIDNTNSKDQTFYINTNQTYTFDSGTVTAAYGTATAKQLNDTLYTQTEVDADTYEAPHPQAGERISGETWVANDVKTTGLKTNYKNQFNTQAAGLLSPTDWYVVKATEVSDYTVPSAITTYRAAVRTKVNAMETAIDNCANVEALITLLEYTTDSDGVTSRPLGEFPNEVI
jgi:hypothetical protein